MSDVITLGLTEFLEQNVKDLVVKLPWMKDREMKCVQDPKELSTFVDKAIEKGICALDTETTGLNTRIDSDTKIVGFSLSYDSKYGIYVPINHEEANENMPEKEALFELKRLCDNCVTIYHNSKFDCAMLEKHGIIVNRHDKFEDTLILGRLYDAGRREIGLKELSAELLGQPMLEMGEVCGKNIKRFDYSSPRISYVYAASDAICTLDLYNFFMLQETVIKQKGIYEVEKKMAPILRRIEANLVHIDVEYLKKLKVDIAKRIEEIKQEVYKLAGKEFNVGSTQQLGKVLFDELKYEYPLNTKTKTGQYTTDTETLQKIAVKYPVVKKIVEFRGLEKSLGTYVENLINNTDKNGCVKLSFNQVGTDTGRFSSPGGAGLDIDGCSGVNVQSIPANYEEGDPDIRKAFIARKGFKIVAIDYSGEELRVATNLSKEPKWMEEFISGAGNLHSKTAQIIYNKPEVAKAERQIGKKVNFLVLYGGGARGLAQQTGITEREAKRILFSFFSGVSVLKKWIDTERLKARKVGYARTSFGRIRPLKMFYDSEDYGQQAHGDRCAVNHLVQGASADIMKIGLIRVSNWIDSQNLKDDVKILITMHDEIVFEIRENKLEEAIPKISDIMRLSDILQDKLKWEVPLTVDAEYGDSWHVDHNFFEELSAEKKVKIEENKESVHFQVGSDAVPPPPTTDISAPIKTPEAPVLDMAISDKVVETLLIKENIEPAVEILPFQLGVDFSENTESEEGYKDEDFVYTLYDTSERTLRLLNIILEFLKGEEKKKRSYQETKSKLILRDRDNNSLLVEDIFVWPDAFLSIMRFFGV